jgi:P2-related tail formation protein
LPLGVDSNHSANLRERSVDVWSSGWPVAVRRDVIVAAPAVHRQKGTRYAVAHAADQADVDVLKAAVRVGDRALARPGVVGQEIRSGAT